MGRKVGGRVGWRESGTEKGRVGRRKGEWDGGRESGMEGGRVGRREGEREVEKTKGQRKKWGERRKGRFRIRREGERERASKATIENSGQQGGRNEERGGKGEVEMEGRGE